MHGVEKVRGFESPSSTPGQRTGPIFGTGLLPAVPAAKYSSRIQYSHAMPPQLYPATAEQEAHQALAHAGLTGLTIKSDWAGPAYIKTTVRVSAHDKDRALDALRTLYWAMSWGADARGEDYEVWISRRRSYNI